MMRSKRRLQEGGCGRSEALTARSSHQQKRPASATPIIPEPRTAQTAFQYAVPRTKAPQKQKETDARRQTCATPPRPNDMISHPVTNSFFLRPTGQASGRLDAARPFSQPNGPGRRARQQQTTTQKPAAQGP